MFLTVLAEMKESFFFFRCISVAPSYWDIYTSLAFHCKSAPTDSCKSLQMEMRTATSSTSQGYKCEKKKYTFEIVGMINNIVYNDHFNSFLVLQRINFDKWRQIR